MALECELFQVYCIKHSIDAAMNDKVMSEDEVRKEVEELFSSKRNIKKIMHLVSKRWTKKDFNQYVRSSSKMADLINEGFKSVDLNTPAQSIYDRMFKLRNRILHSGVSTSTRKDAIYAYNHARLALMIINDARKKGL